MSKNESRISYESVSGNRTDPAYSEEKREALNLSQLLSSGPTHPARIIPSFLSVIAAVEAEHLAGRGPCDLEPRKVIFWKDGTVELSARKASASGSTVVVGSSKYSAPEMFEETTGPVNINSYDSYVLGFVFYEILLGKDLFDKQFSDISRQAELGWLIWHADKTKHATPAGELISGFPHILSRLVEGMMMKDPSKRITDLKKISQTIASALQATAVYSLADLHAGEESFSHQEPSASQEIEGWRRWLSISFWSNLRNALFDLLFPKKNGSNAVSTSKSGHAFQRIEGKSRQPAQFYGSPNQRKGSGLE